jgi:hypothetical protein
MPDYRALSRFEPPASPATRQSVVFVTELTSGFQAGAAYPRLSFLMRAS